MLHFIHRVMLPGLILGVILAGLPLRKSFAQNPPTAYTPYGTPYDGTESWYCERVSALSNGRCNFTNVVASITTLANLNSASALTTTGTITAGGAATAGYNLNLGNIAYTGTLPNAQLSFTFPLSLANGGTGTATPALVAGGGITISGSWPNNTIAAANGAGTISTPSNPAGITGSTAKMLGLAGAITPTKSGIIFVGINGDWKSGANGKCSAQIRYGTGGAPSNGTAAAGTGTAIGSTIVTQTGVVTFSMAIMGVITGAALNTALWLDLAIASPTGDTCTVADLAISAMEQ